MPIINTTTTENYIFALWKIEEDIVDLLKILNVSDAELKEINGIKHLHRKKQNISARILLNHLAKTKVNLKYHENGSPYCSQFKHISISHSKNYCTAISSNNLIGIDIQYRKKNIRDLSAKFINKSELEVWSKDVSDKNLHLIWCIKESVYKTLKNPTCSLKENIYVTNLKNAYYQDDQVKVLYNIHYETINNYFIAIVKKT